jgi:predicted nucleic acid-binding Zn ribbon protein
MDKFFTQTKCDRCGGDLKVRRMSWFTEETICMECAEKESEIKRKLHEAGRNTMEGCGFIPTV